MNISQVKFWFVVVCASTTFGNVDQYLLTIGDTTNSYEQTPPYFWGRFDAGGYSDDGIYYGPSPIHGEDQNVYGYHELLSGEWGAAIYYDGIDTDVIDPNTGDRQAMWLTTLFKWPNWETNSNFVYGGTCFASANPNNPAPLQDTGQSVIRNGQVEITIDYEVVDLEPLGSTYSPMAYIRDPNGTVGYVLSDRYVFLQTYTIRNISDQTLTGLEFYQFLHSHGADEYAAAVNSTYTDISPSDPLANYTPYNPVHQVGTFCFDITQWNQRPFSSASHVDYVGFSSTVEPDWIDNDVYDGNHSYNVDRRLYGTHINIENRQLNGIDRLFMEEVGGAMGWAMGSLDPNATTSMTIAFMFAPEQESSSLIINKTIEDPETCYGPGDTLTYKIEWENIGVEDAENAVLTDYFPAGLTYEPGQWQVLFDPNLNFTLLEPDPLYKESTHSYQWYLGTIPASSSGELFIEVVVNSKAPPGMTIRNEVFLETSIGTATAAHNLPICCYDDGPIYVDSQATGANTGTSWQDAFKSLQSGLARAAASCGNEIWVKRGTYDPGRQANESFVIPAGTSVYGGFVGNETSRDQRNPNNRSILTGAADVERNVIVVRMGDSTILDGFVVTGADNPDGPSYGVYGSGADFSLINCVVEKNSNFGIRAINGNVTLEWCYVRGNGSDGISHSGAGFELSVSNSWIMRQRRFGVFSQDSTPRIFSSIISESDLAEVGNAGVRMQNPALRPVLYNCTLAHNKGQAIFFTDNGTVSDPNDKDYPDIQNCILWLNNSGNEQFAGFTKAHIQYSCVYDPNDPDGEDETLDSNKNFSAAPEFLYVDPNNVRIRVASRCVDAGNPLIDYSGLTDFDGSPRVMGEYADIGAYEVDPNCLNDRNDWDTNHDGRVNYADDGFYMLAQAWLSRDPNDPSLPSDPNLWDPNEFIGWNPQGDFNGDYVVDLADLMMFVEEAPWLWCACWLCPQGDMQQLCGGEMMLMGQVTMLSGPLSQEKSIPAQMLDLASVIVFLEQIWLDEPDLQQRIDPEDWQEFMDSVYQSLLYLRTQSIQLE